jgi:hypothetical protein
MTLNLLGLFRTVEPIDLLPPELEDASDYIEVGDTVQMQTRSGRPYLGTVILTDAVKQRALVEYVVSGYLWSSWREADEMTLILKSNSVN